MDCWLQEGKSEYSQSLIDGGGETQQLQVPGRAYRCRSRPSTWMQSQRIFINTSTSWDDWGNLVWILSIVPLQVYCREHNDWLHHALVQEPECSGMVIIMKFWTLFSQSRVPSSHNWKDLLEVLPHKGSQYHQRSTSLEWIVDLSQLRNNRSCEIGIVSGGWEQPSLMLIRLFRRLIK